MAGNSQKPKCKKHKKLEMLSFGFEGGEGVDARPKGFLYCLFLPFVRASARVPPSLPSPSHLKTELHKSRWLGLLIS